MLPWIHRSLLSIALVVPMATVVGCATPAEEESGSNEEAFTRKSIKEGASLRVTATQLNLRSRAGTSSSIIAVLVRGDIVTCAADSGNNGWVNVTTSTGKTGWASLTYLSENVTEDESPTTDDDDNTVVDGDTCSPDRGANIVNRFQKALHDTIAHAEGTRDNSKDGYNIIFSGIRMTSCNRHPNRCIKFGSTCSTAAGRYQFLVGTWRSVQNVKGYATFEPENQERGAQYLIGTVRRATVPQDRALNAAEFETVITKLSFEWASLPPGQYGQPMKSMRELRDKYCSLVTCN